MQNIPENEEILSLAEEIWRLGGYVQGERLRFVGGRSIP
jgi:hypothetical protein